MISGLSVTSTGRSEGKASVSSLSSPEGCTYFTASCNTRFSAWCNLISFLSYLSRSFLSSFSENQSPSMQYLIHCFLLAGYIKIIYDCSTFAAPSIKIRIRQYHYIAITIFLFHCTDAVFAVESVGIIDASLCRAALGNRQLFGQVGFLV